MRKIFIQPTLKKKRKVQFLFSGDITKGSFFELYLGSQLIKSRVSERSSKVFFRFLVEFVVRIQTNYYELLLENTGEVNLA